MTDYPKNTEARKNMPVHSRGYIKRWNEWWNFKIGPNGRRY